MILRDLFFSNGFPYIESINRDIERTHRVGPRPILCKVIIRGMPIILQLAERLGRARQQ